MSAAAAVFRRELIEKRKSLLFCLAFGLLPLIAPAINALVTGSRSGGGELREILAVLLAITLFVTAAFLGGVTTIGRDLAEQRLSFYFSRPISPGALWGGKIAATFVVALASGIGVLLPALIIGGGLRASFRSLGLDQIALAAAIGVPFFALVGHAIGISVRSKSAWLLLDVLGIGIVGFFFWTYVRIAVVTAGPALVAVLGGGLAIVLVLGLAAAGYAQLALGRTEIRSGHRALSIALWTPVLGFVALAIGYIAWLSGGTPADLNRAYVEGVSPRGDWISVFGPRRYGFGYINAFLFNPATGASEPLGLTQGLTFSGDGRTAVAAKLSFSEIDTMSSSLVLARLDRSPVHLEQTDIVFRGYPPSIGISDDGSRLATFGSQINVIDLRTRRSVMSANVPEGKAWGRTRFIFLPGEIVRCYAVSNDYGRNATLRVFELNLRMRTMREIASIPLARGGEFAVTRDGQTVVSGAEVRDASTGNLIRRLGADERPVSDILSDGRIIVAHPGTAKSDVAIFRGDGSLERTVELPAAASIRIGGEIAPGQLLLQPPTANAWVVDLTAGTFRRMDTGGWAVAAGRWFKVGDPSKTLLPGSLATRLVLRPDGSLVEIDPAGGAPRVVVQGQDERKGGRS